MTGGGRALPHLAAGTMLAALAGAAAVAVVRILTHYPFHDECLHVGNLFLMSEGLSPHRDFWCNYPVAGYVLTRPVFALLPKTAASFLALRFLMLVPIGLSVLLLAVHGRRLSGSFLWGVAPAALILVTPAAGRFLAEYSIDHIAMLAAVAAIVCLCAPPRPLRLGAAIALGLLSIVITPKYGAPLALGTAGLLLSTLARPGRRRGTVIAVVAGVATAVLVTLVLSAFSGTSPAENVRYAHLLMADFKLSHADDSAPLAAAAASVLLRNLPLAAIVVLGVWGWIAAVRQEGVVRHLGPAGVLLGTLASLFLVKTYMLQYVLPVLVSLAAFAPWAGLRLTHRFAPPVAGVVTLGAVVVGLLSAVSEFDRTPMNVRDAHGVVARKSGLTWSEPAVETLKTTQRLLDRIPASEPVLAVPQMTPVFRRGLTYLTADEVPSFATLLRDDDPARPYFDPAHLRERLATTPPAFLCLDGSEFGFPPGWRSVMEDYLRRNRHRYVRVPELPEAWLRADLARGW